MKCGTREPIRLVELQKEVLSLHIQIDADIERVVRSGIYLNGSECAAFEQEFARYIGAAHGVSVASGTDALQLALMACDIGAGDGVVTVANGSVATAAAIELAGADPIFVDVDPRTFTMRADLLEEVLTKPAHARIRAVVPVHLYGCPAPMKDITRVAHQYGARIVEDCAQSHGASLHGRMTGTFGDVAAFSFYPTKNLGALGDGGMLTTNSQEIARRAQRLKQYGWQQRYVSEEPGINSRMDEIQAAVLRTKLQGLDSRNRRRRSNADRLTEALKGSRLILPTAPQDAKHVYHQYVVLVSDRERFRDHLLTAGIESGVHYPVPIHRQPAYRDRIRAGAGGLAVTESLAQEVVSLPIHPYLTEADLDRISLACRSWVG